MKRSIYCCYALTEPHHPPISNIFSFLFKYFSLINFSLYNYNSSNISFTFTFLSFHYSITLTLQFLHPFILFFFFFTPLFPISFAIKIWYSPFHSINIFPIQKGEYSLSLSLSIIYSFLQFYFRLMIFCTFCISTLNWYILVICFFCSLSHVLSLPLIILIWVNSYILWKWKFEFI